MDPIQNIISKPYFIIPYLIWVTVWKGIALWKSAKKNSYSGL